MPCLAIISAGRRPGAAQIALAYWPWVLLALFFLSGAVLVALRRRRPEGKPRRVLTLAVWAVLSFALGCGLLVRSCRSAPPAARLSGSAPAWPTFMGGASRRGSVTAGPGPARPHKRWSFRDGVSPFAGSPAVWADRVFVGSDNRCLYCLDANDGRRIWRFKAAAELFAAPAIAEDRVWIGEGLHETTRGKIYCLRARDGAAVWEFETRSHVEFGVSLLGGRLYAAAGQDGVYCLDAATGGKIWQHGGLHVDMSVLAVRDGVFLGTAYGSPCFLCLEAESGALRWRTPSPMAVRSSPSTDGARVCFGVGNGTFSMGHASPTGAVVCLDIGTGALLWTTDFVADAVLTTVALADGRAFFGSRDGGVYGVDARTGRRIWRFETGSPVLSSAAAAGGRIYAASEAGVVFCLDAGTGRELWRYDSSQLAFSDGRVVGSPAIANGRLYLGSMNSLFFCLGE